MPRLRLSAILFALGALPPSPDVRAQEADASTPTVIVTVKKEPVVKKLDKTVYDVSDAPRAANGSAQDVLQSIPEVSVTADGQIAVKGNKQVTVLVDGKPTAMLSGSSEERAVALQTMRGADIAGIEVITNPSAAYNANGGAILDIVLKHNRRPGAHAQVQGSTSDQGLWNAGASGDFTRGPISAHDDVALDAHGQSSSITPLGREGATSSVNLSWKHKLGKTLSLTVNANDIFDGSRRSYRTYASTFRQSGFDHFVARRVVVGFVKKFE